MAASEVLAVAGSEGFRLGLVATSFGFGFRHGIDWDHIAALTDITSAQESSRRSMVLATMYALGHAAVVFALGVGAIVLADQLPAGVDDVMERVVGVTLVLLALYVFVALARHGRSFRMRSRWMLIIAGARRGSRWLRARRSPEVIVIEHEHEHAADEAHLDAHHLAAHAGADDDDHHPETASSATHRHAHRHVAAVPEDPFMTYGRGTAFGVGMIHGIGAETPTQVLIFLAAAQAGGKTAGVVLLLCFVAGLLTSNSVVALAATFGYRRIEANFTVYAAVSLVTAFFSLTIGALFLLGQGGVLPAIFSG
jgi:ABC-type nickel/cobalt efflux system permease component RcnA